MDARSRVTVSEPNPPARIEPFDPGDVDLRPSIPSRPTPLVLLGLGANIGNPLGQLQLAVRHLSEILRIDAVSSVYRTEPVGGVEQPDYLNIVALGRMDGSAIELHLKLLALEEAMGRRRGIRNGPRIIDIDLLVFGDAVSDSPQLTIPHPRLHERAFVLAPLCEIAPEWRHPALGKSAAELLACLGATQVVQRIGLLHDNGLVD